MSIRAKITTAEWIAELQSISVAELVERIRLLEETFGVSAAVGPPAPPSDGPSVAVDEDDGTVDVVITEAGPKKIAVIKVVRTIVTGLGLKEAKQLVDEAPATVAAAVDREAGQTIAEQLRDAGATVELR